METMEEIRRRHQKNGEEHQQDLNQLRETVEGLKRSRLAAIEDRYRANLEKLTQLHETKGELLTAPMTRNEFVALALGALREYKAGVVSAVLLPHLEECQRRGYPPFSHPAMRVLFDPDKCWKLLFLCVSEADLQGICQALPDSGLPRAEVEAQIQQVDQEIGQLLKAVKKPG
jgi:hypothetical protein